MIKVFGILILLAGLSLAQNTPSYLWPTNASTLMSSSFCEFRDGHYHSAIDIKTWVREGYKCFAIEDGRVERIRVSPFGYGKVIYIRLKDGNMAVYAHLQRFNNRIEKQVRKQQIANQKYSMVWYPKNMQVKKGDIIAYTGRTGIGVPHLHFEIRNAAGNPVNPLQFYQQVKDNIRPRLKNLAVLPLDPSARVNSSQYPQIFDVDYIRNGIYVIREPIYVTGRIGLMIYGFDQADGASNKYGFNQTVLNVDSKEIFRLSYDELEFATTRHIFTEIYYPFWALKRQVFNKLYIDSYNPLNFYRRIPGHDGTITVSDQPRDFEITVSDFHGNKSIIKGELIADLRPEIILHNIAHNDTTVYLSLSSAPFNKFDLSVSDSTNTFHGLDYFEIIEGTFSKPDSGLVLKTYIPEEHQQSIKIHITGYNNVSSVMTFPLADNNFEPPLMSVHNSKLLLQFKTLPVNSRLVNSETKQLYTVNRLPDGSAEVAITFKEPGNVPINLLLTTHQDTLWSEQLHIGAWPSGNTRSFSWFDSSFTVTPKSGTFLDTALVIVDTTSNDSLKMLFPVISKTYSVLPKTIPTFKSAQVRVRYDSLPAWGNWNLFKTNGKDKLSFVSSNLDTLNGFFSANTSPFGNFVIACDSVPPILEVASPVQGGIYRTNPDIQFNVSDEISGIGDEENISIRIDGQFVLPEWDPEDRLVTARIDKPLTPGNHMLTISVSDKSKNTISRELTFTIQ